MDLRLWEWLHGSFAGICVSRIYHMTQDQIHSQPETNGGSLFILIQIFSLPHAIWNYLQLTPVLIYYL